MQRKARESHVLVTRSDGLHASFDGIKHAVIYSGSAGRRAAATRWHVGETGDAAEAWRKRPGMLG